MDVIFTLALVSANIKGSAMDEDVRASRPHIHNSLSCFQSIQDMYYTVVQYQQGGVDLLNSVTPKHRSVP